MERYAHAIMKFRWVVLLLIGGLSVFFTSQIGSLEVRVSNEQVLPQTHPFIMTTNRLETLFGGKNQVVIGVVPRSGTVYQASVLQLIDRISTGLLQIPDVIPQQVLSLTVRKAKAILGTEQGMDVQRLIDPQKLTGEELERIQRRVQLNPIYLDSVVSRDGTVATILADFHQGGQLPSFRAILKAVNEVIARERSADVDIVRGGLAVNLAWLEIYADRMLGLFFLALVVVMSVLYFSFRSVQGMLVPTFTALLSAAWALGIMACAGISLDMANVTTPILIMAIAAGHSVQMLKRYYEEFAISGDNQQAMVSALIKIGPVMLIGGTIAMMSFLSLLTFDTQTIRTFGLFTACGVASAVILEMSFMPALRSCLSPPRRRCLAEDRLLDHALAALARAVTNRRWGVIFAPTVVVVVLLAIGVTFVRIDNSMKGNFKADSEVRHDDGVLNTKMAGTNTLSVLIEGPGDDSIKEPVVLHAMQDTQRYLEQYDKVGKTVSIVDYLVRINQALNADDPAASRLPKSRELVSQYLLLYSSGGDPRDFDSFVDDEYRHAVLSAFVRTDSTAYLEKLITGIQSFVHDRFPLGYQVSIGGGITQGVALNQVMIHGKILNIIQIGAVVGFLSALVFGSLVAGLLVLIPLVLAVLANFGVMGLAGIRLDIGTSVVAAMAVGIGADYAIYVLYRLREEYQRRADLQEAVSCSLATAGKAVIYVSLSVALGYAVLVVSDLQFHVRMGVMVAVTMMTSCLAAVVLLPTFVALWAPQFIVSSSRVSRRHEAAPPL